MNIPDDLRYSKEHEWARSESDLVRVGISDFAQDSLGDVVFVDLPEVGAVLTAGAQCGEIESTKSVSEIYTPIGGTVIDVNGDLDSQPQLVNSDPYGDGWLFVLAPTGEEDELLDAAAYRELVSD